MSVADCHIYCPPCSGCGFECEKALLKITFLHIFITSASVARGVPSGYTTPVSVISSAVTLASEITPGGAAWGSLEWSSGCALGAQMDAGAD